MRVFTLIAVIGVMAAFGGGIARADYLKGDPRKCSLSSPRACAAEAAQSMLRLKMAIRHGRPANPAQWTADVNCTSLQTNYLKWRCTYKNAAEAGTAVIWFRPLSTGWHRVVTITPTP